MTLDGEGKAWADRFIIMLQYDEYTRVRALTSVSTVDLNVILCICFFRYPPVPCQN